MKIIKHKLRLIYRYLIISFKLKKEFRSEFISYLAMIVLDILGIFLFWYSINNSGIRFGHWNLDSILVLNGFFFLNKSITTFSFGYRDLEYKIIDGSFDTYMIRPHSPFFLLIGERLNFIFLLINFFLGCFLIAYGVITFNTAIYDFIIALIISIMAGVVLELMYASFSLFSFYFGRIYYVRELFFSVNQAKRYPLDIFPNSLVNIFTYFIPIVVIATIPTKIIIDKTFDYGRIFLITSILLIIFLFIYTKLKTHALNSYTGTGN